MPSVGVIKPSNRPTKAEELVAMLPASVTLEHAAVGIATGTPQELREAIGKYDGHIEKMAALDVDLIHTAGVPPLLLGYEGERELVQGWEDKYGKPVFTNGQSQVNALRAFGAKRIVGAGYFPGEINKTFGAYLTQAGFDVLAMEGMDVGFQAVTGVAPEVCRAFIRSVVSRFKNADAIYLLGPAWRTLEMLESMEEEFGIPIVHHIPAQSWEIQKRFGLKQTFPGYGKLIGEMP
jgi:maleate cis-trans isomerase